MRPVDEDFEAFVRRRSTALLRTAVLLTGDRGRAEDVLQETLVQLAQRWGRATRGGSPEAYARSILYSRAMDQHRWFARRPEARVTAVPEAPVAGPDADTRVVLEQALARLTPRQRALLVLRYYDDLTEVATARALRISPSTVKSETRTALARLRTLAPDLADAFGRGDDPAPVASSPARPAAHPLEEAR